MNGKKILIKSSLTVTKYFETMLIENYVKHLTIIPNNFSRISQLYVDWTIINHGVPQGTVLEPLVFILYVNEFGEEIGKSSNVLQFADDTAILCHEKMNSV